MRLKLHLQFTGPASLPINYQYPLSAAIYKIIQQADAMHSSFLHDSGYGKGHKLFVFSDLKVPFAVQQDRLLLKGHTAELMLCFHMPKTSESFIEGLFLAQEFDVADQKSKVRFRVNSVEMLPDPLLEFEQNDFIKVDLFPISPVVAAVKASNGHYSFLSPEDVDFASSIQHNCLEKIKSAGLVGVDESEINISVVLLKNPPKSRLITIKANSPEETKIRAWQNFLLRIEAPKPVVNLLLNAGVGLYNAQGMGCVILD
jgi:CRISPR-associated endoribonuclease Cas6